MQDQQLQDLADFIASSPTPFHATATLRERLIAAGFEALNEREDWQLKAGGRYWSAATTPRSLPSSWVPRARWQVAVCG